MSAPAHQDQGRQFGWIALYTKANQEKIALTNVMRQGYHGYCPLIERTRRHARKVETVQRPLFPSYIFVRLEEQSRQWRPLLSTTGVRNVVRFKDKLGFLPDGFVEELRAFEKSQSLKQMAAPKFEPGTKVKIVDGPFENVLATVLTMSEQDRVWLLIDIMGREARIQQDVWAITA